MKVNKIPFQFQAALNGELDLNYLSCQTVNVSFAAVSLKGISQFSPSTEILVYGGMS